MGTNGRQCVTCDENDQRTRRRLMEKTCGMELISFFSRTFRWWLFLKENCVKCMSREGRV